MTPHVPDPPSAPRISSSDSLRDRRFAVAWDAGCGGTKLCCVCAFTLPFAVRRRHVVRLFVYSVSVVRRPRLPNSVLWWLFPRRWEMDGGWGCTAVPTMYRGTAAPAATTSSHTTHPLRRPAPPGERQPPPPARKLFPDLCSHAWLINRRRSSRGLQRMRRLRWSIHPSTGGYCSRPD